MRLTFLSHFVICLAVAAGAYLAFRAGALAAVWQNDMSMMTSVIGGLFVLTAVVLGREAWRADSAGPRPVISPISGRVWDHKAQKWGSPQATADFGHLAERLAVMAGLAGTGIGLSLQAHALAGGASSFTALATSLFTMICGVAAAALIALMTFNLERGMRRGAR